MGNSYSRVAPLTDLGVMGVPSPNYSRTRDLAPTQDCAALTQNVFHSMLTLERRRAERSSKAFVLMLLDARNENGSAADLLRQAAEVAHLSKRETDLVGWYQQNSVLGVVFIEVNIDSENSILQTLRTKVESALSKHMGRERSSKISISLKLYPSERRT